MGITHGKQRYSIRGYFNKGLRVQDAGLQAVDPHFEAFYQIVTADLGCCYGKSQKIILRFTENRKK